VESPAAILTGPPFDFQQDGAQPLTLSVLVPAILRYEARSVSLIVKTVVTALA
jgi:hypothetical protein